MAAEALTNIAMHSGTSSASVTARQHDGVLAVEVSDDGHGGGENAATSVILGMLGTVQGEGPGAPQWQAVMMVGRLLMEKRKVRRCG